MATYTSREGLILPEGGDNLSSEMLSDNFGKIDAAIGDRAVTSTTRPNTPYLGQKIWESDANIERIWDGSNWRALAGRNTLINLAGGFAGTAVPHGGPDMVLDIQLVTSPGDGIVDIRANYSQPVASGTGFVYIGYNLIPERARPSKMALGPVHFAQGYMGTMAVDPAGSILVSNRTGVNHNAGFTDGTVGFLRNN